LPLDSHRFPEKSSFDAAAAAEFCRMKIDFRFYATKLPHRQGGLGQWQFSIYWGWWPSRPGKTRASQKSSSALGPAKRVWPKNGPEKNTP
jgi:hypothetical protein